MYRNWNLQTKIDKLLQKNPLQLHFMYFLYIRLKKKDFIKNQKGPKSQKLQVHFPV